VSVVCRLGKLTTGKYNSTDFDEVDTCVAGIVAAGMSSDEGGFVSSVGVTTDEGVFVANTNGTDVGLTT